MPLETSSPDETQTPGNNLEIGGDSVVSEREVKKHRQAYHDEKSGLLRKRTREISKAVNMPEIGRASCRERV